MDPDRPDPAGSPSRRRLLLLFALVALAAYVADQLSKWWAVERLQGRPDIAVVGDVLQLHFVRNPGAAFSTGRGLTPVITCVAIVATVVVLVVARRIGTRLWAIALGLLLAGITGNLTDRLLREPGPFRGHVIDMIQLPNWPVFNIADIAINVAAGLIVLQALRGIRLDGTRDGDESPAPEGPEGPEEPGPAVATPTTEPGGTP
ncbi:signal peptidase II [Nocardioides sp.]|uniref:signal peptidase II n=1 Tax=Nocardioides sp. TaxID=35761 RepID=UPI00351523E6